MRLNLDRRQLFVMFGTVYLAEGVIQAYQLNFFKPHMDSAGVDPTRLAIVSTLGLVPFVIKWVFGLVSDRYSLFGRGHRVPYMLIGLASTGVAFAAAWFVDPARSFPVLASLVLAATFFMALFDTTADALSVDVVPEEDHSTVQAWMNGGRAVGLSVVSLAFGFMADAFGYRSIFLAIAGLMILPLIAVSRVAEPAHRPPSQSFDPAAFRALLQPRYGVFALVLILSWTCFEAIEGLVTYSMAEQLDSTGRTIGTYGTIKAVGILIGGIVFAWSVKRFGRAFAALLTVALVAVGGFAFAHLHTEGAILAFAPVWGLAVGFQWTNYVTFTMDVTDLRIAGSMFAILQTMSNIGLGAGEGIGTALSGSIGFVSVFRLAAIGSLAVAPLMLFVISRFPNHVATVAEG